MALLDNFYIFLYFPSIIYFFDYAVFYPLVFSFSRLYFLKCCPLLPARHSFSVFSFSLQYFSLNWRDFLAVPSVWLNSRLNFLNDRVSLLCKIFLFKRGIELWLISADCLCWLYWLFNWPYCLFVWKGKPERGCELRLIALTLPVHRIQSIRIAFVLSLRRFSVCVYDQRSCDRCGQWLVCDQLECISCTTQ